MSSPDSEWWGESVKLRSQLSALARQLVLWPRIAEARITRVTCTIDYGRGFQLPSVSGLPSRSVMQSVNLSVSPPFTRSVCATARYILTHVFGEAVMLSCCTRDAFYNVLTVALEDKRLSGIILVLSSSPPSSLLSPKAR